MQSKIKAIVGSVRFWVVTLAWLSAYLGVVEADGFTVVGLFDQVSMWLGSVVAIGTVDSIAEKIGGK